MTEDIKQNFAELSQEYDKVVLELVPFYTTMIDAIVSAIPYAAQDSFRVLELGSGTGNVTKLIKERFPQSQITCVDLVPDMIAIAQNRLQEFSGIEFIEADYGVLDFGQNYDVVLTSLAFHHIVELAEKKKLFQKSFDCLNAGGIFCNGDVILGNGDHMQELNVGKWKEFMRQSVSDDEIENKWIPRYHEKDHPFPVLTEIELLKEVGFKDVDVMWKYYNVAAYSGRKN